MNLNEFWDRRGHEERGLSQLCCACGACSQACPQNAIIIKKDNKGFYYPIIDEEKCINCGICVKKCQCLSEQNIIETTKEPEVYACINNDIASLKNSSSGGLAYVLGEYILEQNGVVFGAVYTDKMDIVHYKIESKENLWRIQGSKYAQSRIDTTYKQAEACLKKGCKVLFTGTPCQIGGLYYFLGKDYQELYTMDIICYGAASSGVFKDYVAWKEEVAKGKITHINFRSKLDRWGKSITEIVFHDRKKMLKYSDEDEWYQTFISHVATRESCHYCKYTNLQRMSDITVGDFWGIERYKPEMEVSNGISKVLLNTNKGKELFWYISDRIIKEKMPLESSIRPNLVHPPKRNPNRERFFEDYCTSGFYIAFKNNVKKKTPFWRYLSRWIKVIIKSKAGK